MTDRLRVIEFVAPGLEALALGLGYFEEEGLEVEITLTRSSVDQRESLQRGDSDVGLTAVDNLIPWNADGDDLRLFCQVERITVNDLFVTPEIQRFSDLRGAVVAVDATTTGFAIVLRRILDLHGLEEGSYTLLSAGGPPARFEALTSGQAQAGLIGPPLNGKALGHGLHRLTTVENEFPELPGISGAVSAARIDDLRPRLTKYVRGLDRAARWAPDNRDEALAILAEAGFPGAGGEMLFDVCPKDVVPSPEGVELIFSMRETLGLLPAHPSRPADILDLSVLDAVAR